MRQKCTYAGIIARGAGVKVTNKRGHAGWKEKKKRPAHARPADLIDENDNSYQ